MLLLREVKGGILRHIRVSRELKYRRHELIFIRSYHSPLLFHNQLSTTRSPLRYHLTTDQYYTLAAWNFLANSQFLRRFSSLLFLRHAAKPPTQFRSKFLNTLTYTSSLYKLQLKSLHTVTEAFAAKQTRTIDSDTKIANSTEIIFR